MRITYAGDPSSERADAWTGLLEQLGQVSRIGLATIGDADLSAVDLLVVDGEPLATEVPAQLCLAQFPMPTVLIGGTGGRFGDAIGLKLGWRFGCVCLRQDAIVSDQARLHPIFTGPVAVPDVEVDRRRGPENFYDYASVKQVPADFPFATIHAQQGMSQEELKATIARMRESGETEAILQMIREMPSPGLVTTSAGFTDSPDCEAILGGVNDKAHDYVAVGRQGHFLQWGFHADPRELTPLGTALFLNAIHYINEFAAAPVEALRMQSPREFLKVSLGFAAGETAIAEQLVGMTGEQVPTDTAAALRWYDQNRGYLRHVGTKPLDRYLLDPDLIALGVDNDDRALPRLLSDRLDAAGADGQVARRLWQRYLHRDATDAAAERIWFETHEKALFFSDWAGYRWISRDDLPVLVPPSPGIGREVRASLAAHRSGGRVTAVLEILNQQGTYVYGQASTEGSPLTVTLPTSSPYTITALPDIPTGRIERHARIPLEITGDGHTLELEISYQACDEQQCHLPVTLTISCPISGEE